ncbi:MAG: recombinase family protein [Clostridiales bacterium]|nr:recombinase family protein [Clostridiales bacterium]
MNYGYARVSSKDQNLERQFAAFDGCGIKFDRIFYDKKSGTDFERRDYKKLMTRLRAGDLVVIKSIDRLGRNYDCILCEWKRITKDIGADIYVLDMPLLDTRYHEHNLIGKLIADIVLQLLSFVAENERATIRTRQAEGIRAAKARGVKFGRPKTACPKNFPDIAKQYLQRKIPLSEALALSGMKPSSFYRYYHRFTTDAS